MIDIEKVNNDLNIMCPGFRTKDMIDMFHIQYKINDTIIEETNVMLTMHNKNGDVHTLKVGIEDSKIKELYPFNDEDKIWKNENYKQYFINNINQTYSPCYSQKVYYEENIPKVKMPDEICWGVTTKNDFSLCLPTIPKLKDDDYLIGYRARLDNIAEYKNRIYIFVHNFYRIKNIKTIYEYCEKNDPISIWLYFDKMPDNSYQLCSFLPLYSFRMPTFQRLYSRIFD